MQYSEWAKQELEENASYRVGKKTVSTMSVETLEKVKRLVSLELAKRNLKQL